MIRVLGYLLALALASWAAVWLADHPGRVVLRWRDYELATSVAVLAVAVAVVAAFWALIYHFWRWLRGGPRRFGENRAAKRQARGYRALTQGLVAAAAGDVKATRTAAREAGRLVANPLNLVLLAQAAQLAGDEDGARRHFEAMLEHPETAFLGLRGLMVQATKAGDWERALEHARRAHALRPDAEWAVSALFDLETRIGDWTGAQKALESAARHKLIDGDTVSRRRAVVLAERARAAEGRDAEALALAREAHKLAPELVAAAVLAAERLAAAGKTRAAAKAIERSWARHPRPDLARAYLDLAPDETAMRRVKRVERLAALAPDAAESRLAHAEAALAAELWGIARHHLEAVAGQRPSQRVYRLLAIVEEHEGGDAAAVRDWLMRAASAPPDAAWVCRECGAVAADWHARCPSCATFDGLEWKVPPVALPTLPAAPEPSSPAPATPGEPAATPPPLVVDAPNPRE